MRPRGIGFGFSSDLLQNVQGMNNLSTLPGFPLPLQDCCALLLCHRLPLQRPSLTGPVVSGRVGQSTGAGAEVPVQQWGCGDVDLPQGYLLC